MNRNIISEKMAKTDRLVMFKGISTIMTILFALSLVCNIYFFTGKPKVVEVQAEQVEIEPVIKYVEKSKTPTKDFLTYLNAKIDPLMAEIIAKSIDEHSKTYQLPRTLVCALIRKESNINPFATSNKNAVGLMQIMPKIHEDKLKKGENPYHIDTNIRVGCQVLKQYLDMEKGSIDKALHRYLGLGAGKQRIDEYRNDIYGFASKTILYDYQSLKNRENSKKENIESNNEKELKDKPITNNSTTDGTNNAVVPNDKQGNNKSTD